MRYGTITRRIFHKQENCVAFNKAVQAKKLANRRPNYLIQLELEQTWRIVTVEID